MTYYNSHIKVDETENNGEKFFEANRNKSVTRLKIVNRSCHPAAQAYIEGSCAEFFIIKHRGITGDN